MKARWKVAVVTVLALAVGGALAYRVGFDPKSVEAFIAKHNKEPEKATEPAHAGAPAVTIAKATVQSMTQTVLVTGTLVPREEILVAPEIEGLRVVDLKVDVGDRVAKGDVLAVLERTQVETQRDQNNAAIARADAAIAQARSQIDQAEAARAEAKAAFERAEPLKKSGFLSESVYDQRAAAARTTAAQVVAAKDGLKLAEASKQELEAKRREIEWRLSNTEVKAPRAGIVSRRTARIGGLAAGAADPMFRIIANGEIELDAAVIETDLPRIQAGQTAAIDAAGADELQGKVRLVSPEVDRATRLGTVKILIGDRSELRIGSFARATIVTAEGRGIAIPAAAILYSNGTPTVLAVKGDRVEKRSVKTGLRSGDLIEIVEGLVEGDTVVAKAGTFLRDGDHVRPVTGDEKVSEAR